MCTVGPITMAPRNRLLSLSDASLSIVPLFLAEQVESLLKMQVGCNRTHGFRVCGRDVALALAVVAVFTVSSLGLDSGYERKHASERKTRRSLTEAATRRGWVS